MKHSILSLILAATMALTCSPVMAQTDDIEQNSIVKIEIDSDSQSPEVVKERLKSIVDTLANKIKDKVDTEVEIDMDNVTSEDLQELVEIQQAIEKADWDSDGHSVSGMEAAVAIVAIIFSLGLPIIVLLVVLWFGYRKRRQKMDLINKFISNDQAVPSELMEDFNSGSSDPLRSGLQWTIIGAAVAIAFLVMGNAEVAALGLIPIGLGISRLAFYKMNKQDSEQS